MRALCLSALMLSLAAHAGDDLNPENVAKIKAEQAKASKEIDKKYGNKKSSELSTDERRQMIQEKAAAENSVLEKHGTDQKSFARAGSKMSREDRAATESAGKALEQKEKDAEATAAADAKKGGKKEIVIEKNGKGAAPEVNEAADMDKEMGLGKGKK